MGAFVKGVEIVTRRPGSVDPSPLAPLQSRTEILRDYR